MKMKKMLSVLLAAGMIATVAAGCGSSGEGGSGDSVTLRIGDNWGSSHPMAAALDEVFKPQIEEQSGGAITVEVYHDGLLGDEGNLWQSVRDGSVDFAVVGTPMNQEFPMMLISDWPFLYRDLDHAKAVWTGEVADEVTAAFNEFFPEVEMLSWGPNSARTFSSAKPLTCVDDFAGQKFRMPNNPIHIGIVEDLGASAQVIGLGELFTALETGTVDGQDNGMVTIVDQSFQEVQSYLYETNHIIATLEIIANKGTMDRLTEEQQTIVRDAAKAAAVQAWDEYIASIDEDRATIEEAGVTVTQLTDEERTKMIEKIQPTIDTLLEENADWAPDLIAKIDAVQSSPLSPPAVRVYRSRLVLRRERARPRNSEFSACDRAPGNGARPHITQKEVHLCPTAIVNPAVWAARWTSCFTPSRS